MSTVQLCDVCATPLPAVRKSGYYLRRYYDAQEDSTPGGVQHYGVASQDVDFCGPRCLAQWTDQHAAVPA